MKIRAVANIDNEQLDCYGEINIHSITDKQAYITWTLFNNGHLIASLSTNYFISQHPINQNNLLEMVIKKIENYRIGRIKIFKDVTLCE